MEFKNLPAIWHTFKVNTTMVQVFRPWFKSSHLPPFSGGLDLTHSSLQTCLPCGGLDYDGSRFQTCLLSNYDGSSLHIYLPFREAWTLSIQVFRL
ncbi:hypothetical protein [Belliella aquatica]|uniref:hypothetical protein n=1 Tax=Belliella aquatica TaxID=1323734 RepID=UPI00166B0F8C|nr:hypothetical protein [Belliella aquatica]MCH7407289.1 hypothetical protein [Belliella aquatica]